MLKQESKRFVTVVAVFVCTAFGVMAQEEGRTENLVKNGSFKQGKQNWNEKAAPGWIQILDEDGMKNAHLTGGMLEQKIELKPEWKSIKASAKMRCKDFEQGDAAWKVFRLALAFMDANGKVLQHPSMPQLKADSGWTKVAVDNTIPEGATALRLQIVNFGKSGTCDMTEIEVTARD